MSTDLVDTTEMYLKAVYELEEEGIRPIRARLVERLDQSKPTVSETVGRLERQGLVVLDESNTIHLTHAGRRTATGVMRKHRLAERLLLDVIGLPWDQVHDEACRWEHVMSRQVTDRVETLVDASFDPYGNPIPEVVEGPGAQAAGPSGVMPVSVFLKNHPEGGLVELARIGEVLQTDGKLLRALHAAGTVPGVRVVVTPGEGGVRVAREDTAGGNEGAVTLPAWALVHLFIAKPCETANSSILGRGTRESADVARENAR